MDEVTLARFMSKVWMRRNGCWEWTGTISQDGYAVLSVKGQNQPVHRLAYEHWKGPIPPEHEIDHCCHSRHRSCLGGREDPHRRCVYRGHLEAVTDLEHAQRSHAATKTHCVNDHEYTPANTYVPPGSSRQCRLCRDDRVREWLRVHHPGTRHGTETHCPKDHPYSGDNLIIKRNGARVCRECHQDWNRRQMRAKRALERGYVPLLPGTPICPVGHDLTGEDSFIHEGQLVCLICMTPDGSRSREGAENLITAANSALALSGMLF